MSCPRVSRSVTLAPALVRRPMKAMVAARALVDKKLAAGSYRDCDAAARRRRIYGLLARRGYEPQLIRTILDNLPPARDQARARDNSRQPRDDQRLSEESEQAGDEICERPRAGVGAPSVDRQVSIGEQ